MRAELSAKLRNLRVVRRHYHAGPPDRAPRKTLSVRSYATDQGNPMAKREPSVRRSRKPGSERGVLRSDSGTGRPSPTSRLTELVEEQRESFDEAAAHATQRREFTGLRLGPVADVPAARLPAGAIGWRKDVEWAEDSRGLAPAPDSDLGSHRGVLYFVLLPRTSEEASEEASSIPVRDLSETSVAFAEVSSGYPRTTLIASAESEVARPVLRRFAAVVWEDL